MPNSLSCPLCGNSGKKTTVHGPDKRRSLLCPDCGLIFVEPGQFLSRSREKARYQQHRNSIDDAGYVRFLEQVLQPLLPHLTPCMRGLDYGCGPNPVLADLVRRHGLRCAIYDPLFADRPLHPPYDFLFCTECFEHFRVPARDIARICALLKPGGWLGIMTELWTSPGHFSTWAYARDPTHVAFFHERTLHFLCQVFPLELIRQDQGRVAIFRRTVPDRLPLP